MPIRIYFMPSGICTQDRSALARCAANGANGAKGAARHGAVRRVYTGANIDMNKRVFRKDPYKPMFPKCHDYRPEIP